MPSGSWYNGWLSGDVVSVGEFKKGVGAIYDSIAGTAVANFDITPIVGTYAHLRMVCVLRGDNASSTVTPNLRLNNDSAANYDLQQLSGSAATPQSGENLAFTQLGLGAVPAASAGANLLGTIIFELPFYAGGNNKLGLSATASKTGTSSGNLTVYQHAWAWRSNAVITRITLLPSAGNWVAGSRVTVYAWGA